MTHGPHGCVARPRLPRLSAMARLPRRGVRVAGFTRAEVREVAEMRAALEALALRALDCQSAAEVRALAVAG